jgi:predicted MFS family arabinose efflux permease
MFAIVGRRLERALMGSFPEDVRRNVWVEMIASISFGIFHAIAIAFMPVVLRRLGAEPGQLAFYAAQTYIGSILSTLSVLMMRRRRPLTFALICWLFGRGLLIWTFLITDATWLLALTAVFWLLEGLPAPAYARIIQSIYPVVYRGRALAVVRIGMVLAILIATPLAGMALDRVSYRTLFPIAALFAIASALLFTRLRLGEGGQPPPQTRSLREIWSILGQNRRFAFYMLGFSIYGVGFLMGLPLFTLVQVDRLGLSYTAIGYLGLAQSCCWLVGYMYWGRLVDRRGGLWVVRVNVLIGMLVPLTYIWAFNAWTLLPAFIAHGIISAGIDLGIISAGIELAGSESVVEYSALQTTIIGLRGMLAPFIGVALLQMGVPAWQIFAVGCLLIFLGWMALGVAMVSRTQPVAVPE